jgi:DNA-binding transcriptional ArsR family regulator
LRLTWNAELPAGAIHQAMPDVTFGAVSLQLKQLVEAGLMESRAEGRFRYYRANKKALGPLAKALEQMWNDALWKLKLAAELEQSKRGPKARKRKK